MGDEPRLDGFGGIKGYNEVNCRLMSNFCRSRPMEQRLISFDEQAAKSLQTWQFGRRTRICGRRVPYRK